MKSEESSLVVLLFGDKSNDEVFRSIHSLKKDFKFSLKTHNPGETFCCSKNFSKRLIIVHIENEKDFTEIKKKQERTNLSNISIYLIVGNESILLSVNKENFQEDQLSEILNYFKLESYCDLSKSKDVEKIKKNFENSFDRQEAAHVL